MSEYKYGEPLQWQDGPDKDCGSLRDFRGNPVGWGWPYGHKRFGLRVLSTMNFCAGVKVPDKAGGLVIVKTGLENIVSVLGPRIEQYPVDDPRCGLACEAAIALEAAIYALAQFEEEE